MNVTAPTLPHHHPVACWSCGQQTPDSEAFCKNCGSLLAPQPKDYFTLLGLPRTFQVDEAAMERAYFESQRTFHPDRFAGKEARERALSMQYATSFNEAYETLKAPLKRADYLLSLHGLNVTADGKTITCPMLLMEAMEMREALSEAVEPRDVMAVAREAKSKVEECIDGLGKAFAAHDLKEAESLTLRLKYLMKLQDEVRLRRQQLRGV